MEASTQTERKRGAPPDIIELIDVAIFSFCMLSGVTKEDKVRGGSIVCGVIAMLFHMAKAASQETKLAFEKYKGSATPLKPGKIKTLVTSRLKYAKDKFINKEAAMSIPPILYEKEELIDEQRERMVYKKHPRCWRCKEKCRRCQLDKKDKKAMVHFRSELLSPLLDVYDPPMDDEFIDNEKSEDDSSLDGTQDGDFPESADEEDVKSLMDTFFTESFDENTEIESEHENGGDDQECDSDDEMD